MMRKPLDSDLTEIALAIADGRQVEWAALESAAASEHDRQRIARLRTVADVGVLHASGSVLSSSLSSFSAFDSSGRELPPARDPGATWAHLQIRERIGEGRFGVVYRAWDPVLERDVALKLLRRSHDDGEHVAHEARLMARLDHPNVVAVYGAAAHNGQIGIWMQFVKGATLEHELARSGPFSAEAITQVAIELTGALQAVHTVGLLHRDIKAANIIRDTNGRTMLGDFGTGRVNEGSTAGIAGTPLYVAPELLTGGPASAASDIYSLGVLLFHLATGAYPVAGRTLRDIKDAHALRDRESLAILRPDLPGRLIASIERALAPQPADRWTNAAQMRAAFANTDRRRPSGWLMTAAILIGAAIAWGGIALQPRQTTPVARMAAPTWLLLGTFTSASDDDKLGSAVAYALERELMNAPNVRVASRARIDDTLRLMKQSVDTTLDRDTAREICLRDGALPSFIVGSIDRSPAGVVLSASLHTATTGESLAQFTERAADISSAVRAVSNRIRATLGDSSTNSHRPEALERVTTPSLEALRLYSESYRLGAGNDWGAALELARLATESDPLFPAARIWLAWCLLRTNAPPPAYRQVAAQALALVDHASSWERLWIQGSYHSLHGDDERAIAAYEGVLRLHPDHYWAAGNIAIAYGRLGRYGDAVPVALKLADLRPHDHRTLNIAFSALRRASRLVEAKELAGRMRTAHEREQRYWLADAWLFDAYVAWSSGDTAKTKNELTGVEQRVSALNEAARSSILPEIAHVYLALGQSSDAYRVIDLLPDVAQRDLQRAIAAAHLGDHTAARAFAAGAQFGRNDVRDIWDRIWVLARAGATRRARELITLAKQPIPSTSAMVEASRARDEWLGAAEAQVAMAEGRPAFAIKLLRTALPALMADVTVTPSQMYRAAETLADALVASGRPQEAIEQLKTVLARHERSTFAGSSLWSFRCAGRLQDLSRRSEEP